SGALPAGWTIVDNAGSGQNWLFVDPEGQPNNTGGSGLFAVINSDFYGPFGFQDSELRTPVINLSSQSTVSLQFDSDYKNFFDTADVDVSSDGGSNWTNVWERTADERGPDHENIDISGIAGNQANVMVR